MTDENDQARIMKVVRELESKLITGPVDWNINEDPWGLDERLSNAVFHEMKARGYAGYPEGTGLRVLSPKR